MSLNRTLQGAGSKSTAGFTLVELIVTMVVAGIILAIAVPSLQGVIRQNRVATEANDFISAVNYARSEAVTRGVRVTMCKSAEGAKCATTGNWDQGWIIFPDPNDNATVDSGESILRVHAALKKGTLQGNTNVGSYISFAPTGFSELASGAFQAGTVTLKEGSNSLSMVLSAGGRIRTKK